MNKVTVTLLLPGYALDASFESIQSDLPKPNAPQQYRFSEAHPMQPWQAGLARCLNIDSDSGLNLPSAALNERAIGRITRRTLADAGLVRADPVHLKADKDNATLTLPEQLSLSDAEADSLLSSLNELVAQDAMEFFRDDASQWYLAGQCASGLRSYPPSFLANRKAGRFLPDGQEARHWRRLMTEVQMLLHAHPVNAQREHRGQMSVNSVWFWGGAPKPKHAVVDAHTHVFCDTEQAVLLAESVGAKCSPLSAFSAAIKAGFEAKQVVALDTTLIQAWLNSDIDTLQGRLIEINEQWLQPLSECVRRKRIEQINIVGEDGLHGVCNAETVQKGFFQRLKGVFAS